jgi:hypothetical protein
MQRWHWGLDKGKVVPSILPLFQLKKRFRKATRHIHGP